MSNEERIAVEAVLRSYEDYINQQRQVNKNILSQGRQGYTILANDGLEKARGRIDGCKEVLRDLMNTKI